MVALFWLVGAVVFVVSYAKARSHRRCPGTALRGKRVAMGAFEIAGHVPLIGRAFGGATRIVRASAWPVDTR
jgi:hypothetical protein